MTFRRKILYAAGVLLLLLLVLFVLFILPVWDGPRPDDADMLEPARTLPEEQNAFPLIMDAYTALRIPDNQLRLKWMEDPGAFEEEIQNQLDKNRPALNLLTTAMERGDLQSPVLSMDEVAPGMIEYLHWANLLRLFATSAPGVEDRMECAGLLLDFAVLLQNNEGPLITELVRVAFESIAFQTALDAGRDPDFPDDALRNLLRKVISARPDVRRQIRTKELEYQFFRQVVDQWAAAEISWFIDESAYPFGLLRTGYMFQPNNTLDLFHRIYREQIESLRAGDLQPVSETVDHLVRDLDAQAPWTPRGAFNRGGRLIARSLFVEVQTDRPMNRMLSHYSAAVVIIALNLYHREHGELPATLAELVPALLSEIPTDPWDGEPMRYNRERARVYAIGENLTDNAGSSLITGRRPMREHAEDFVFGVFEPIDFKRESGE